MSDRIPIGANRTWWPTAPVRRPTGIRFTREGLNFVYDDDPPTSPSGRPFEPRPSSGGGPTDPIKPGPDGNPPSPGGGNPPSQGGEVDPPPTPEPGSPPSSPPTSPPTRPGAIPFDFSKGFSQSTATPGGSPYNPTNEPAPVFSKSGGENRHGGRIVPSNQLLEWFAAMGLLPQGMVFSDDDLPMLGGGSSNPWGITGVNATGANPGFSPSYAVVGGQGGYGIGRVGTNYTGPLWNTPPRNLPPPTNQNQSVLARPLSEVRLPSWLMDLWFPTLQWNQSGGGAKGTPPGGSSGGGSGQSGGGSTQSGGGSTQSTPGPFPRPSPANRFAGLPELQVPTSMPSGYTEITGDQIDTGTPLYAEAKRRAVQLFGPNWHRPNNMLYATNAVLQEKKLWNPYLAQQYADKVGRGALYLSPFGADREWGAAQLNAMRSIPVDVVNQWAASNNRDIGDWESQIRRMEPVGPNSPTPPPAPSPPPPLGSGLTPDQMQTLRALHSSKISGPPSDGFPLSFDLFGRKFKINKNGVLVDVTNPDDRLRLIDRAGNFI